MPGRRSFLFSPRFLLFCLYVVGYVALRLHGEIVPQRMFTGDVIVTASPRLPHWRQQLWRALFSPAMVAEEEGQPLIATARDLYDQAQRNRGGHDDRRRIVEQASETGYGMTPVRQQQYAQPQPAPRATSRGNPNGLDQGERMIYDPRLAGR